MDGNGRWGIKNYNSRNKGHEEGIKTVERIINVSIKKKNKISDIICIFNRKLEATKIRN